MISARHFLRVFLRYADYGHASRYAMIRRRYAADAMMLLCRHVDAAAAMRADFFDAAAAMLHAAAAPYAADAATTCRRDDYCRYAPHTHRMP